MMRMLSVLVLLSLSDLARAEDPVYFGDPWLQAAVEDELWISDPTPADMLELASLRLLHCRITDLTGLEYATNLQTLRLSYNEISDFTALSGLSNLQTLYLDNNQICDISALAGLDALQYLNIHDNMITDLSPLAGLSNLQTLIIRTNSLSDISPLSGLGELREVDLFLNRISDISPLAGLTCLEELELGGNPLNSEAFDVYIPLILANNPGIDLEYDVPGPYRVRISSTAGGSVIAPGEGEFIYENGEFVLFEASAEPGFAFVDWSGSLSSVDNPLTLAIRGALDIQANFTSVPDIFYVDDDAPDDPGPGDPDDSDPDENGTAEHPYDRIQEALDVAADGATVVVHPGTYHESINLLGKSIHLTGIEPNGAPLPVIDGDGTGPIVSFVNDEDPNCMLTGFVLTAGKGQEAGAIMCSQSSPTVANCLIVGNRATGPQRAAVYCKDSNAVFDNCTLADNVGGEQGAGLMLVDSDVVLSNSIVWGNTPNQIVLSGESVPSIIYSNIAGGWLDLGNIKADPLFAQRGHWVTSAGPDDWVWIAGDYHLQSQAGRWDPNTEAWVQDDVTSPCIDTGDPAAPVGAEPAPNGGIVNMGAYGGTIEASLGR